MITINLLPQELQRAAKTPKALFFSVIGGIVVTMLMGITYLYLWFNVVVIGEQAERKRLTLTSLEEQASEVDALEDDIRDYKEREKAIVSIKNERILWSRKLDELIKLTPAYIWITKMEMKQLDDAEQKGDPKRGKEPSGGFFKIRCFCSGIDVARMTSYRQGLKGEKEFYLNFMDRQLSPDNFYADFAKINKPSWQFVHLPGYRQENNILFSIQLDLKPTITIKKSQKS